MPVGTVNVPLLTSGVVVVVDSGAEVVDLAVAVDVVDAEGSVVTVVVEVSGEGAEVVVGESEQPTVTTTSAKNPRHLERQLTNPSCPHTSQLSSSHSFDCYCG